MTTFIIILFNMAKIYAGTSFNQVICIDGSDKKKQKLILGALKREPIISVSFSEYSGSTFYASSKKVNAVRFDE